MQYRKVASAVIKKLKKEKQGRREIIELSMENAVQTGEREYPIAVSKKWVEDSDWVVLIVGWHYGTITEEEDAAGIGVTEWEYRHAVTLGKKVFVFVAGASKTADAYSKHPSEIEDLRASLESLINTERDKLDAFRRTLTGPFTAFFKNIKDFEQKLESTLRTALDALPPIVPTGSALAELILSVEPSIKKCAGSINLLTTYKRIHDALHLIRQEVLRPARDGVLPKWEHYGFGIHTSNLLSKLNTKASVQNGKIEEWAKGVDRKETPDLGEALNAVQRCLPIWDPPTDDSDGDREPDRMDFVDNLAAFSSAVQGAFTEANFAMQSQTDIFDQLHAVLLAKITAARMAQRLSAEEQQTLDEELHKFQENAERLKNSLKTHSRWQKLHDEIEMLQGYRDTQRYSVKLRSFFDQRLQSMLGLVEDTLDKAQPAQDGWARLVEPLKCLQGALQEWDCWSNEDQSGCVRATFDDAFFQVDVCTLQVVEYSAARVTGFDALLRQLHDGLDGGRPATTKGKQT